MTLINLWLVPQRICNAACSFSGSRQNFLTILVIICLVFNTYRTRTSSTTSLKLVLWCGFKLSFVWDYCSCSGSCAHFWQGRALLYSKPKAYNFSLVLQFGYKSSLLGSFVERGQCWFFMLWSLSTLAFDIGSLDATHISNIPLTQPVCKWQITSF